MKEKVAKEELTEIEKLSGQVDRLMQHSQYLSKKVSDFDTTLRSIGNEVDESRERRKLTLKILRIIKSVIVLGLAYVGFFTLVKMLGGI